MLYPVDLSYFKSLVLTSPERFKLCGNLRYHNAFLVFPFNDKLKYTENWVFTPVVDLQYMIALYNEGVNITQTFKDWFHDVKRFGYYEKGFLLHKYYQPFYRLYPDWSSGMAQGLLLSCMMRCDPNEIKEEDVDLVLNSMLSGPLISKSQFGLFVEEYPHKNPNMVLNGFLFALISLLEYIAYGRSFEGKNLLRMRTLEYLETFIAAHQFYLTPEFNSFYDIQGRLADKSYHLLHIEQLLAVNELAGLNYGISINYIIDQFRKKPVDACDRQKIITFRKVRNFYHIIRFKLMK